MILNWDDFSCFYSDGFNNLNQYKSKFEAASQTTFALLCCSYAHEGHLLKPSISNCVHAEQNLLQSDMWTTQIPLALSNWNELNDQIIVTMVINRSPCQICAPLLENALIEFHKKFPLRCDRSRFILACLGAYEDKNFTQFTTINDLIRLKNAGWELAVLEVDRKITERGNILLEGLKNIYAGNGQRRINLD
jgi:hypothetical protein